MPSALAGAEVGAAAGASGVGATPGADDCRPGADATSAAGCCQLAGGCDWGWGCGCCAGIGCDDCAASSAAPVTRPAMRLASSKAHSRCPKRASHSAAVRRWPCSTKVQAFGVRIIEQRHRQAIKMRVVDAGHAMHQSLFAALLAQTAQLLIQPEKHRAKPCSDG